MVDIAGSRRLALELVASFFTPDNVFSEERKDTMIEFQDGYERGEWLKIVRAVLKGGSTKDGKVAVKIADYVLEQDRARISKSMKQAGEEFEREQERLRRDLYSR